MAVNMNGEKPLQNIMMDYSIHKGIFLNFNAPNLDYSIFIFEFGKCPKHSGTPAAAPLQRSHGVVAVSNINSFFLIGDGYVIAARNAPAQSFDYSITLI